MKLFIKSSTILTIILGLYFTNVAAAECSLNTQKYSSEQENNIKIISYQPGRHTYRSAIVATRFKQLQLLNASSHFNIFKQIEKQIGGFNDLKIIKTPIYARKANEYAESLLEGYILPYMLEDNYISSNNIVYWNDDQKRSSFQINNLHSEKLIWNVHIEITKNNLWAGDYYIPKDMIALKQIIKLEEVPLLSSNTACGVELTELMPSLIVLIMLDIINKEIKDFPVNQAFNYGKTIKIFHEGGVNLIPLGKFLTFYKEKLDYSDTVAKFLVSEESISFLKGG